MEGKQILQTATVLSVKIKFNEDIRRLSCPATVAWENLKAEVLAKYGLDPKAKVCLKYEDEEGDLVTLGCEADFKEAQNIISATKLLRLTIVKAKRECTPAKSADVVSSVDVVSPVPLATTTVTATPTGPVTGVAGKILTKEEFKHLKHEHKHAHKHEDKCQQKDAKRAMKEQLRQQKEAWRAGRCTKYVARFVKDVATLDETELAPETSFVKTWRFRNDGDCTWPEGCQLIFLSKLNGDQMGAPASVPVASAAVGQEVDVSVPMVAPTTPGRYVGFWRLCAADGQKFGQRVRVLIQVTSTSSESSSSSSSEDDAAELAPLLLQMEQMGFTNKEKNAHVLKKHQGNLASAVAFLSKKQQLKAEKAAQKAVQKAEKKAKKAAKEIAKQQKKEAKSAVSTPRK